MGVFCGLGLSVAMAVQVWNDFVSVVRAHPVLAGMSLVFFMPPFFPIVKFFSPLLISTALFMLALFTMGPKGVKEEGEGEEGEGGDGEKRRRPDGGWMDWVKSIEESSLTFMSPRAKQKRENWKGGESVNILEEASWAKGGDFSSYAQGDSGVTEEESSAARLMQENVGNSFMPTLIAPSMLFNVDPNLKAAAERSIYDDMDLDEDAPEEDAPELEDVEEHEGKLQSSQQQPAGHGVQHQPMGNLQIPKRVASEDSEAESPATDLDSSSDLDGSRRFMLRKNSVNANSGLSDVDTPVAEKLSLSGKLHQMETLGDYIDDTEHAEETGQQSHELNVLQPTTDEQVEDVKDHLDSFVQEEKPKETDGSVPPNPAEKPASTVEATPASKPAAAAAPKGEISEVQ